MVLLKTSYFVSNKHCCSKLRFSIPGTLYNKQRHHSCRVQHLKVMAACVPPGAAASCGGVASYPVSHRLSRLMTVLSFFSLSSESLQSIYSAVFLAWLEEFPAYSLTHHEQLAKVRIRYHYNSVRTSILRDRLAPFNSFLCVVGLLEVLPYLSSTGTFIRYHQNVLGYSARTPPHPSAPSLPIYSA